MSGLGIPSRDFGGPRAGTFGRPKRRRSPLGRVAAKGGLLRQLDWLLIGVTVGLTVFGTVLVWAATEPILRGAGLNPYSYLQKQVMWVVLGVTLMFVVSAMDYRRLRAFTPAIYAVALLLLLAVLTPLGASVNGAKAWIAVPGGFQIEPSEFAKLALVLSTAALLSQHRSRNGRATMADVGMAALAAAPLIALVEGEPALGVMLVLVFALAGMVVVSGIRLYWVGGMAAAAAAGIYAVSALHLLRSYQLTRLTAFLHPQNDLSGAGYNGLQAKIAVGSGGMYGQGLFRGTFTGGSFVPSVQTDFIFTVAGEELGFVGCAVLISLIGILIFRAIQVAQRADDMFGMLVATGVAVWFLFQSFVNIGMTIGIMPITGLPLPFVSYGGSAILADMIAVGFLQSARRHYSLFGTASHL
ncbi:MAG TPA: FtsW/RodA/SpoVE family cell cycle protein [Trebonia sp.]